MASSRFFVILLLTMLTGCVSTGGFPTRPEKVEDKILSLQKKFFLPEVDVLENYSGKTTEASKRSYRDLVIHGRMLAIDLQFSLFKQAIYEEGVTSNLTFDILGVVVGGAGAATTHAKTSRSLSALSGGISGTSTAINKNLYYENTMPALLAIMDSERTTVRTEILKGLTQQASIYPLGRALSDLERYLQVGSIPGAVAAVTSIAGQKQAEANNALEVLRTEEFLDPKAQRNLDQMLESVNKLPESKAWDILKNPPVEIDEFVATTVKARLGGVELKNASSLLSGASNDDNAKSILKMILVLSADRSEENIVKWNSAITAQIE